MTPHIHNFYSHLGRKGKWLNLWNRQIICRHPCCVNFPYARLVCGRGPHSSAPPPALPPVFSTPTCSFWIRPLEATRRLPPNSNDVTVTHCGKKAASSATAAQQPQQVKGRNSKRLTIFLSTSSVIYQYGQGLVTHIAHIVLRPWSIYGLFYYNFKQSCSLFTKVLFHWNN